MSRHRLRTAALVAGVLVLLPAGAAHATLPIDAASGSTGSARTAAAPAQDEGSDADDDQTADDSFDEDTGDSYDSDDADSASADDGAADDDSDSDADAGSGSRATTTKVGSGSSPRKGGSGAKASKASKALQAPRSVRAQLTAFDRVVVSWRPGSGAKLTRWVVTLRAGRTGRLLYLGRLARSATFTALKPGVRYSATVTATASGGRSASAAASIRTPTLQKAVRAVAREQARVEQAARLAKVRRFG